MDDQEKIGCFQKNRDPEVFADLIRPYRQKVFRLAISIMGPGFEGEADDIVQDVFLRVFQHLPRFLGKSAFSSWLYRITYNRAIEVKRRCRYRKPHVSDRELRNMPATTAIKGPHQQAERSELARHIHQCLWNLPDLYRSALYLYYWLQRPVAEIASNLSVPVGTAKSYLHRGRSSLKHELQKRGWGP